MPALPGLQPLGMPELLFPYRPQKGGGYAGACRIRECRCPALDPAVRGTGMLSRGEIFMMRLGVTGWWSGPGKVSLKNPGVPVLKKEEAEFLAISPPCFRDMV